MALSPFRSPVLFQCRFLSEAASLSACSCQCSDSAAQTGAFLVLGVAYVHGALGQQANVPTPPTTLTPTYDADGNTLTEGTGKIYTWDCENRLTQVTLQNATATTEIVRYYYDGISRRIKREHITPTKTTTTTYLYDGWNVIHEPTTTVETQDNTTSYIHSVRSYTWGIDLSDMLQGVGGVGGLLTTKHIPDTTLPTQVQQYHHTYDANGNTSELLDAAGGTTAHYEYDTFGKETTATGSHAETNTYRFSTKPLDQTTLLNYYGYRYYQPETGRWLSRDPIEEDGGANLYAFVLNDGINRVDYMGQFSLNYTPPPNSTVTPFELGIEWLTGLGLRHRDFTDGDAFAEQMRSHDHIQTKIREATDAVTGKCDSDCKYTGPYTLPISSSNYNLGGVEGVAKYLGDYSNLLTFGAFGNLAVTFIGSYGATFTATNIDCCKNTADLEIVLNNKSHAASALRPPVLGYTGWWQTHIAPRVNRLFQSGPGSPTTQKVTLTESLTLSSNCPSK